MCVFLLGHGSVYSQTLADVKMGEILNSGDLFQIRGQYPILKDSLSMEMLNLVSEAQLGIGFNKLERAGSALDSLLQFHQTELGAETSVGMAALRAMNLLNLGLYSQAGKAGEDLVNALKDVLPFESLYSFVFIERVGKALSNCAGSYLERPLHDITVPMKCDTVGRGFHFYIPVEVNGITFKCSEMLYLCGQYSDGSETSNQIQKMICECNNGFAAKKFIRNKYIDNVRKDFNDFRIQWMFWVVWQKVIGNENFKHLLLSVPDDAIIIENSSWQTSTTATIWGCKNMELRRIRQNVKLEIENISTHMTKKDVEHLVSVETNKVNQVGVFTGQNNLGKILMLCREAIKNNITPKIDYNLLSKYDIFLMNKRLF